MRSLNPKRSWLGLTLLLVGACRPAGCSRNEERSVRRAQPIASARAGVLAEPEATKLCAALHELPARRRAECCASTPVTLLYDECVRHLSAAIRARSVTIDAASVQRCAAAVSSGVAGCDWVAPTLGAAPSECHGVVRGRLEEGHACRSSLECAGNLHCEGQGATSTGTCRPPRALGAGCGVGADPLATYVSERGLEGQKPSCADACSLVTHRCEARPEPFSACRASVNCAPDQTCDGGRCEPRAPGTEGSACGSCAEGFHCVSGGCTAREPAGGACKTDLECAVGGCVLGADGAGRCGMKCSSSFGAFAKSGAALPLSNR